MYTSKNKKTFNFSNFLIILLVILAITVFMSYKVISLANNPNVRQLQQFEYLIRHANTNIYPIVHRRNQHQKHQSAVTYSGKNYQVSYGYLTATTSNLQKILPYSFSVMQTGMEKFQRNFAFFPSRKLVYEKAMHSIFIIPKGFTVMDNCYLLYIDAGEAGQPEIDIAYSGC